MKSLSNAPELSDIIASAKRAGSKIMEYYSGSFEISEKADSSKVTEADLASQEIISRDLEKFAIPMLSEEQADPKKRLGSRLIFIVDPLDGTNDFISRTGEFCVIIALVENHLPVLGVVYCPFSDELFYAEKGQGAFLTKGDFSTKLSVSPITELPKCTAFLSRSHLQESESSIARLAGFKKTLSMGSAGLKICQIAAGRAEVYINLSDKASQWDTCAGALILKEAGGKITDTQGNELIYNIPELRHKNGYVVTNAKIHEKLLSIINQNEKNQSFQ